ncbi:hypothetical protein [Nonomuraea dietziae]|uniref:hypothetical protein n=1 Tax=Nonomuraea dietziae TaxID=65515 RepID=UPI0033FF30A7
MSTIRRTTWLPLGHPIAGELMRNHQAPAVPISFGNGDDLIVDDLDWARDLATAVAAAISVLESEHGLVAASEVPPLEQLLEERNTYRELLTRIAEAQSLTEVRAGIRDARLALEHWATPA